MSHLKNRGFTLIELLVVVLILAILMAVALPAYLSAVKDSAKKTCRANMQTIANAVQAKRVKDRLSDYSTLMGAVDTAKETDLPAVPVCPDNGTYSIGSGIAGGGGSNSFAVSCTLHGSFEPGVNSQ